MFGVGLNMNLFFRLFILFITRFARRSLSLLEEGVVSFRAMPNDLDIYGHINNGRYLTLMDLGRIDWIWRVGLGAVIRRHSWNPLVAGIHIRYKRPVQVFDKFEIRTRLVCWDDKWFYIEQTFFKKGNLVTQALVKGLFRGPEGNVPPQRVLDGLGAGTVSPAIPEELKSTVENL